MGKTYQGGWTGSTGFKRTSEEPIEDSMIVDTIDNLTDGTIEKPYRWMKVTMDDTGEERKWNGNDITDINNWIETNSGGGDINLPIDIDDVTDLQSELDALESDITDLNDDLDTASARILTNENDIDTLESNVTTLEGRVLTNENDIANIESDLEDVIKTSDIGDDFYIDENGILRANVSTFKESFVWSTGDSQTFTLSFEPTNFIWIAVDSSARIMLTESEYTYTTPNQLEILGTLEDGDRVVLVYEKFVQEP